MGNKNQAPVEVGYDGSEQIVIFMGFTKADYDPMFMYKLVPDETTIGQLFEWANRDGLPGIGKAVVSLFPQKWGRHRDPIQATPPEPEALEKKLSTLELESGRITVKFGYTQDWYAVPEDSRPEKQDDIVAAGGTTHEEKDRSSVYVGFHGEKSSQRFMFPLPETTVGTLLDFVKRTQLVDPPKGKETQYLLEKQAKFIGDDLDETLQDAGVKNGSIVRIMYIGKPEEGEEPLPKGWEKGVTPEGKVYYIDHKTKSTHPSPPSGTGEAAPASRFDLALAKSSEGPPVVPEAAAAPAEEGSGGDDEDEGEGE